MVCAQRLSLGLASLNNQSTGVGPKWVSENLLNRNDIEDDDKSAKTCTYFFSSLAKLGIDVNSFRKRNDMRGLMDACLSFKYWL